MFGFGSFAATSSLLFVTRLTSAAYPFPCDPIQVITYNTKCGVDPSVGSNMGLWTGRHLPRARQKSLMPRSRLSVPMEERMSRHLLHRWPLAALYPTLPSTMPMRILQSSRVLLSRSSTTAASTRLHSVPDTKVHHNPRRTPPARQQS